LTVFGDLRSSIQDLFEGRTAPADRAAQIRQMKQALVHARMAIDDMRAGAARTRARLGAEQTELTTVRRRREAASGIGDQETVQIAEQFAASHAERVAVLEAKLAAQDAEVALAERELGDMTGQLKAAAKGVGDIPAPGAPSDAELGLPDDAPLRQELDGLRRATDRQAAERDAEDRLAELKKKMGK
jgi:phage shock protein A